MFHGYIERVLRLLILKVQDILGNCTATRYGRYFIFVQRKEGRHFLSPYMNFFARG